MNSPEASPRDLCVAYDNYYRKFRDHDSPGRSRLEMASAVMSIILQSGHPANVLDIGGGRGDVERQVIEIAKQYQNTHARQLVQGSNFFLVDIAEIPPRRRISRKGVTHVRADSQRLPVTDNAIDIAFSNLSVDMLRRYPDAYQRAMKEVVRVLKIGARALFNFHPPSLFGELSEAYRGTLGDIQAKFYSGNEEDNPYYKTEEEIRQELAQFSLVATGIEPRHDGLDSWWRVEAIKEQS